MAGLEEKIKDFIRSQGIQVVGLAGPERLDGPPSLDPAYTLEGARSIVSLAMPMDVPAIYDFLSKKSPVPHNLDQLYGNQKLHHISARVADYIRSLGYEAKAVPSNNTYRRSPDIFSTHPSFAHRLGAIAAGIAGQGLSGNVMTKEYGAAVYLGTVVTTAVLKSDPALPPRHFVDTYCATCRICAHSCPAHMFEEQGEEYLLINGELHPRAKRRSIDLCNISCFGLHGLSMDKKWSSWGTHWITKWVEREPDPRTESIRIAMMRKASTVGDSTIRYELIRRIGSLLYPEDWIDEHKINPRVEDLPQDETARRRMQADLIRKYIGLDFDDPNVLTCGQCALVCGPDIRESAKRIKMLHEGGIVVRGKDGRIEVVKTFEEASAIRTQYPVRIPRSKQLKDMLASTLLWVSFYGGIEPRSFRQGLAYRYKLKKAVLKLGRAGSLNRS